VHSPTTKIALALLLSIAVHSLLLIPGEPVETYLSQNSIIHARLDKQDKELIQQEQTGQISQQHNKKISEASDPSQTRQDQPLKQEASKAQEKSQEQPVISSKSASNQKALNTQTEDVPTKVTQQTEVEELVEKTEVAVTQPTMQQSSQISSDSRAQVEALEGSEDPTYSSYRRVLRQYLAQRLEANSALKGRVRLKIKLEYGSIATHVNIIESSGDLNVDNWAKKSALAANPYPKIPKEIGSTFEFSPTLQLGSSEPTP
jgi:outer membrane biosynthesis protein TonB